MTNTARRFVALAVATTVMSSLASGYYHFVRFDTRFGPFVPIPDKFDVNALPAKTVFYFVSDRGPAQLAPGDTTAGLLTQLRAAARVWNAVETSALRVGFGGFTTIGLPQTTPGIDVVFDEVPPGLLALGVPTVRADTAAGPNGAFTPILRSQLTLRRDLSLQPSSSEAFFLTLVHEFGHTLGLQHTLTSSVMSTQVTRATTKAKPLAVDDIAGVSMLYPTPAFSTTLGSLSGRVLLAGQPQNMASVVALAPGGHAVSALTNPDGTYRIDGMPPAYYYVYVHPLPPALAAEVSPANIVFPLDADRRPLSPGPNFETVFFPGTKEPLQALALQVNAGATVENVNFAVQPRSAPPVYAVETFSFPGQVAVRPAYVNLNGSRNFLLASGPGLTANNQLTPGLTASVIGGSAAVFGLRPYSFDPRFVQVDFTFSPFSGDGPRHLLFTQNNEIYVRPAGLNLVPRQPPGIISATGNGLDATGRRQVVITGSGFNAETRVWFDGIAAAVREIDEFGTRIIVAAPPAPSGHVAAVTALNADGQSSLFLQDTPTTFTYEPSDAAIVTVNPAPIPAGAESMIEIIGINTGFADGAVALGFGSSDVAVRRMWVVSPTRMIANVSVAPGALSLPTTATVLSGLHVMTQPFGFQAQPANPRQISLSSYVMNMNGSTSLQPGGAAIMAASNLPAGVSPSTISMSVSDRPAQVVGVQNGQVTFIVPAGLTPGPAIVRLFAGSDASLPIVINIDPPPPIVLGVLLSNNTLADAAHPARPGETLSALVAGLADLATPVSTNRVTVNVGGVDHIPQLVQAPAGQGLHQVTFALSPFVAAGALNLTVSIDGRVSAPVSLTVR